MTMKAFRIISVVLLMMGGLLSQAATTAQMRFHCSGDTTTLDRLLLEGQQSGISQPEALVRCRS